MILHQTLPLDPVGPDLSAGNIALAGLLVTVIANNSGWSQDGTAVHALKFVVLQGSTRRLQQYIPLPFRELPSDAGQEFCPSRWAVGVHRSQAKPMNAASAGT